MRYFFKIAMRADDDERIINYVWPNNKTFEHASLIFTEPWALANEIMLNS